MSFWNSYRIYDSSIDKYFIRWLKDYHIYYDLPHTFKNFIEENNLIKHYPNVYTEESFDLLCKISKYDIRKSSFFTEDNSKLITDCFYFVTDRIRQDFENVGICFFDFLYSPTKKLVPWTPFKDALFYNRLKQPDRKVVLSDNEIYICINNEWAFGNVVTSNEGRQLIGYVMKQMESVLKNDKI